MRADFPLIVPPGVFHASHDVGLEDRKSTRLNSSHSQISYAVFCLKKQQRLVLSPLFAPRLARSAHASAYALQAHLRAPRVFRRPRAVGNHIARQPLDRLLASAPLD